MLKLVAYIVSAGLILLASHAYADAPNIHTYSLAPHGVLLLPVPPTWNQKIQDGQPGKPPTLLFAPEHGSGFAVEVTSLWPTAPDAKLPSLDQIKLAVTKGADEEKPEAAETDIPITELQGTSGSGYYFKVTDRAPKPGEFKYMTRGMLRVAESLLAFTILCNDDTQSAIADALAMLKGGRIEITAKH